MRLPGFADNRHMKVISLSVLRIYRLYPQGKIPGSHFCYSRIRTQGHSAAGGIRSKKNLKDPIGKRTRNLPARSAVPQPTALPQTLLTETSVFKSDSYTNTRFTAFCFTQRLLGRFCCMRAITSSAVGNVCARRRRRKKKVCSTYTENKIRCTFYICYCFHVNLIKTRQVTYIQSKTEARSRNHCCRGKAVSIKYSECVSVVFLWLLGMKITHFCTVLKSHLWSVTTARGRGRGGLI